MLLQELKVLIISHTDLDGFGSTIIGKHLLKYVTYKNLNNDDVEDYIENIISTGFYLTYDVIFICDLNVSKEYAEKMDSIKDFKEKLVLLDHHEHAKYLNKYDWAKVVFDHKESKSGTELFYDYLKENLNEDISYIKDFAELIKIYDIWEWKNKYNGIGKGLSAKNLNDLFQFIGAENFQREVIKANFNIDRINKVYEEFKSIIEFERNKYIENHKKDLVKLDITNKCKIGLLIADRYISELGNIICEENKDIKAVFLISSNHVAIRSIGDKFNCGELAKLLNGGGHINSAGFSMSKEELVKLYEYLTKIMFYNKGISTTNKILKFFIDIE